MRISECLLTFILFSLSARYYCHYLMYSQLLFSAFCHEWQLQTRALLRLVRSVAPLPGIVQSAVVIMGRLHPDAFSWRNAVQVFHWWGCLLYVLCRWKHFNTDYEVPSFFFFLRKIALFAGLNKHNPLPSFRQSFCWVCLISHLLCILLM